MATPKLTAETCKRITDLVRDYFDDRLSPTRKRDFRRHLRICPDCVGFLNTYKETVALTRAIDVSDMPPAVRENILTFLRRRLGQTDRIA